MIQRHDAGSRFGQAAWWRAARLWWRRRRRRHRVPPVFEPLEHRVLLSTVTVTNVNDMVNGTTTSIAALIASDGGDGISLREAITAANADSGVTDTIAFNIAGGGPHSIAIGSALPDITDTIIIDGETEPDFGSSPIIELDGSGAGAVDGLRLAAGSGGSTIRGLVINQFGDSGIEITSGSNGNTIEGNYIGTNVAGTSQSANIGGGINIVSNTNTIGGTTAGDRNLISGNTGNGILITGDSNTVEGNYIGLDVNGTNDLGNTTDGIEINGGANNTIGGTTAAERNVISGNDVNGIHVTGAAATGNDIQGNYIGLDQGGTLDRGNASMGVLVDGSAASNTIGGTASGAGNVISGNDSAGVQFNSAGTNNAVKGNYVGTDAAGTAAVANTNDGIDIDSTNNTTIGGTTTNERNVISGNGDDGIDIDNSDSNLITGNYIGVDSTGLTDLGNTAHGIRISLSSSSNTVGGSTASLRNIISGNNASGVNIRDAGSDSNIVIGNYIGTDVNGTGNVGNSNKGVIVQVSASNNSIGGAGSGEGNVIAFNGQDGIRILSTSTGNSFLSNSIHSNTLLGIDLNNDGVTANDANDGDTGANGLQNFPVLNAVATDGAGFLSIDGTLDTDLASQAYRIEFFTNAAGDASGNGEGETFVTAITVTTDGSGDATFKVTLSATAATGTDISATATVDLGGGDYGSTSEFSAHIAATTGDLTVTNSNTTTNGDTSSVAALVASNGGDGISLHEAITAANNTTNTDTINFSITGGGPHVIAVSGTLLPTITDSIIIDGSTEPDYAVGAPVVFVDGQSTGSSADGLVISADNSTIRGLIISGFGDTGIVVTGDNNTIVGNFIGPDETGTALPGLHNEEHGIWINGGDNNIVGGTAVADRNIISGNDLNGINIDSNATGNIIRGNYIGTDKNGTADLGNSDHGISISGGAATTTVGGTAAGAGNVISGNNNSGIEFNGAGAAGNTIHGNIIGLDVNGTADLGNTDDGILIVSSNNVTVGGTTAAGRNVISGNDTRGVYVNGGDGNTIQGNYIGTDQGGMIDRGNTSHGVYVDNTATNTTIGGTASGTGNVISGNNASGIQFNAAGATGNVVKGNIIGADFNGTAALGNSADGVEIIGTDNVVVGGTTALERNVIVSSGDDGIEVDVGSNATTIQGNYVGLGSDGTTALGNTDDGLLIQDAVATIGGTTTAERNVISSNGGDGVEVANNVDGTVIQGNYIGTDVTGTLNRGNTAHGILISTGADNSQIGGVTAGAGNAIWYNGLDGVAMTGTNTGNAILGNSIDQNAGLGIDLGNNGVTGNDANDPDTGANGLQNFPVITAAVTDGTQITLTGTLDTDLTSQAYRIEFYWSPTGDASGNGEGPGFLGATSVTTDGSGNASFTSFAIAQPIAPGADITAIAAVDLGGGNYGSTSEFSTNFVATDSGASVLVVESTTDVSDGTTTSIAALFAARGADGVISLREAITAANNTAGIDTIRFNIPDPFVTAHTLTPGSALPNITQAVTIDATTEPDYVSTPVIELDGSGAGAGVDGLSLTAGSDGSTIRGLVINQFADNGIEINNSDNNTVAGNYIGTDVAGAADLGNTGSGVQINGGGSTNTIGGTVAADRNVISGNNDNGIEIINSGTTGNIVQGNYIGTDVNGTAAIGNAAEGVNIWDQSTNNTIGGLVAGARNVISGNNVGIAIEDSGTTGNQVHGNYIGTDVNGTADLGNTGDGVQINLSASSNTIGGNTAAHRNVISGNDSNGVYITSDSNTVEGNYIGLDATGASDVGNTNDGIEINGGSSNTIGGTTAGERNVISGNNDFGVRVTGATATGNTIEGNYIGLDQGGTVDRGNSNDGVLIDGGAATTTVGGTVAGSGNVISGNDDHGIRINGGGAAGNTIQGNLIGTDFNGTVDRGNLDDGIQVNNSDSVTIGGTVANSRNIISGNNDFGIQITGSSSGTVVEGNYIGLGSDGSTTLGNSFDGIRIQGTSSNVTIGGNTASHRNVISSNGFDGIDIRTNGHTVQGNYIGLDSGGTLARGNSGHGVNITSDNNLIGGDTAGEQNTIAHNTLDGIAITGSNTGNSLLRNLIFGNGGLGIDLADDGVTANDANDVDTGDNNLQNTPDITEVDIDTGAQITVVGTLDTDLASQNYRIEFFKNTIATGQDATGSGEGEIFLDAITVTTDGSGDAIFNTSLSVAVVAGEFITATATVDLGGGNYGNTSEFAINVTAQDINDEPAGADNTVSTLEDTDLVFVAGDFGFTDTGDSPADNLLNVIIATTVAIGILYNDADLDGVVDGGETLVATNSVSLVDIAAGQLKFKPVANANGTGYDSFTFQVQDDGGTANGGVDTDASANTMTIDVTSVNDEPAGADNTVSTLEDTDLVFVAGDFGFTDTSDSPADALLNVILTTVTGVGTLFNDADLDGVVDGGEALVATNSVSLVDIAAGQLKFKPVANGNGTGYDSFTFQVQDDGGTANGGVDTDASANTMTIDVTSVNDEPAGADNTVSTLEDTDLVFVAGDFGFTDTSDSPADALLNVILTTVTGVGTLFNDADLDGVVDGGETLVATNSVSLVDIAAGQLKFKPVANANGTGYDSFTFQVQDDGGTANGGVDTDASANTMTIDVTSVNDEPAGADNTVSTLEDTDLVFVAGDFGFTDTSDSPANALLNVILTTVTGVGTLFNDADLDGVVDGGETLVATNSVSLVDIAAGQLKFKPVANANGTSYDSFTFQVQDDGGTANGGVDTDASANTMTIDVTSVNDEPAGADNTVSTLEDTDLVFVAGDFGFTDTSDSARPTLVTERDPHDRNRRGHVIQRR